MLFLFSITMHEWLGSITSLQKWITDETIHAVQVFWFAKIISLSLSTLDNLFAGICRWRCITIVLIESPLSVNRIQNRSFSYGLTKIVQHRSSLYVPKITQTRSFSYILTKSLNITPFRSSNFNQISSTHTHQGCAKLQYYRNLSCKHSKEYTKQIVIFQSTVIMIIAKQLVIKSWCEPPGLVILSVGYCTVTAN